MRNKLIKILNNHGIIYEEINNSFHCFVYSDSSEYDVLTVSDKKIYCNSELVSLAKWLGY